MSPATVLEESTHLANPDVLIVGSGPIGAVFARTLLDKNYKVLMIDVGQQETRRIGDHKKNNVAVQKDISLFTNTVKGELDPLSVPTSSVQTILEPACWTPEDAPRIAGTSRLSCKNGQNPDQKAYENLPGAAATRVVGGMGSHWTCCTPRQHPTIERSNLFNNDEWDDMYTRMEGLFNTNTVSFDNSIRQQLVKDTLHKAYEHRELQSMPLACQRNVKNKNYVEWSCTATILGDYSKPGSANGLFEILPNTQCMRLGVDENFKIQFAEVKDLLTDTVYPIRAKKYVICAGAVLTPGILFNSKTPNEDRLSDSLPALGHYLTEQPMAFCQVVLNKTLVNRVENAKPDDIPYGREWAKKVAQHEFKYPEDPLPFPYNDPDPQCYFPLSEEYPWHTQIHRDAFGYGEVPPAIDQRLIVDLRWFTYVEPDHKNYVAFSDRFKDSFGMPQPTFHFNMSDKTSARCEDMITDMISVARKLGGFLPGAEPKYLAPGSALHICGTYRAGKSSDDSVVDKHGKVWGHDNLVLGGCGVIPTQNASNPTITAACFALAAAEKIAQELEGGE
ncbi:pyranose 2-oxidase [Fusarium heterosporum]|uniref:Pyranose 2-oxidase n=1 Tax=Fusarium heterosporum TaxID=42747 RepID=A0A8H5TPT9_FUSHE|nr:pyranose 2-oxidase [Fusarium heterosporum]